MIGVSNDGCSLEEGIVVDTTSGSCYHLLAIPVDGSGVDYSEFLLFPPDFVMLLKTRSILSVSLLFRKNLL
jgi:hypothetical protein